MKINEKFTKQWIQLPAIIRLVAAGGAKNKIYFSIKFYVKLKNILWIK